MMRLGCRKMRIMRGVNREGYVYILRWSYGAFYVLKLPSSFGPLTALVHNSYSVLTHHCFNYLENTTTFKMSVSTT